MKSATTNMTHILFINLVAYSRTGGIENFSRAVMKALSEIVTGGECTVEFASLYDSSSPDHLAAFTHNFSGNKRHFILHLIRRVFRAQVVISNHINLLPVCALLKLVNPRIKIYTAIYGIDIWRRLPLVSRLMLKISRYLSISEYTTHMGCSINGIDPKDVLYFPCCYSSHGSRGGKNPFDSSKINLLSVSRLSREDSYKGIDHVIRALERISTAAIKIEYTVVGQGDDLPRLRNLANSQNQSENVTFTGFVEELLPYYEYCDIFVLPSQKEGFGIVYLEAMDFCKPVIACRAGGATDVVKHEETGLLCEYGDIDGLANAIRVLSSDKGLRDRYGKLGRQHLLDHFTPDHFKKRLKNILLT